MVIKVGVIANCDDVFLAWDTDTDIPGCFQARPAPREIPGYRFPIPATGLEGSRSELRRH